MKQQESVLGNLKALCITTLLSGALLTSANVLADPESGQHVKKDDLSHPLGEKRRKLRQEGLEAKIKGTASGKTHRVANGQYVELEREGEDAIFTILAEFSDFPHNNIAEPNRSVDNTTNWRPDFSREHFMNLMFSDEPGTTSVRQFYAELSSNRYAVNGDVTEWVPLPGTAVDYDDSPTANVWQLIMDSANGWYDAQLADGKTPAEIEEYLARFDVWDRYDYDGDGNFDEPDGYIDHMQSVHAGEGEEAGGGALGATAIWSHRWFAYFNLAGIAGPDGNLSGGVRIGQSSKWIGDYTIEPENGGVGVFAHEFGHDLGLPDLYATQGGANGTGFWTLMSSGSWLGNGTIDIGSRPGHMGAWEKLQLGWLNYEVANAGAKSSHKLGPAYTNTKQAQALVVVLPDLIQTNFLADPYAGDNFYYSGAGNNLDNFMTKTVNLAAGSQLTAMVNVNIEADWDYAYLVVSTDGGENWDSVDTNISSNLDPFGQNFGFGITGSSGGNWIPFSADLSAYNGEVMLGFRYWTDGSVANPGLMIDEVSIAGDRPDGAEVDAGWAFAGFSVTTGTETEEFFNAYIAEFRQYKAYDTGLRDGPYNFGFFDNPALGNYVEHFPYQDGLLVSYWNTMQSDNNTPQHPGAGLILPIDANPTPMLDAFGNVWRPRVQIYDATFGLESTDAITLHQSSVPSYHPSLPAVKTFDDRNSYWDPANPWGSVITPNTGTQIRIKSVSAHGSFMQVQVRPAKK